MSIITSNKENIKFYLFKKEYNHVTLLIGDKDFLTVLNDLRSDKKLSTNNKSSLTSRKNNYKNGGKVVFLDDVKLNSVAISKIYGCNEKYDGHIAKDMCLQKYISPHSDCKGFRGQIAEKLMS